jgi:hypothetical protein
MVKDQNIPENFKKIKIRWPNKPGISVISGKWHRLPDGRIEAIYTRQDLKIILGILEGILSMPGKNKGS